ncbi:MAG: energy-coupling factor ABC transporter permease [Bryobacteraceae bacterium]
MHIPDGFLSTPVWAALGAASAASVGIAARRAERNLQEGSVPLLGVMGAFVFAAQMINFPVGLGTSGHLLGGALLACTLGPWAATVVMTAILAVQALVFQDGGLLALGANVFNMGVAGVFFGYLPFHYWGTSWRRAAAFLGGTLSVLIASSLALLELRISGVRMPGVVVGISAGLFAVSAVLEGAITMAAFAAVERINRAWIHEPAKGNRQGLGVIAGAAALLATAGAMLASSFPDGLEKLAETLGIEDRARTLMETPFADYELQSLENPMIRKAVAGLVGLTCIYLVCLATGRVLMRRRNG